MFSLGNISKHQQNVKILTVLTVLKMNLVVLLYVSHLEPIIMGEGWNINLINLQTQCNDIMSNHVHVVGLEKHMLK